MLYPHNTGVKEALYHSMERAFLPKRAIKSLIMLSGGLDSVALLASVLAHTDHEVHAHHIEIRNSENRAEIENQTLARVLPYMREHYRPFTYSTSTFELMMGMGGGLDMTLATFMAARVTVAEGTFQDLVMTGHVNPGQHEYNEAAAVFAASFLNHRYKPIWIVPLSKVSKFDIYNAIPPELAEMTWSCRTPKFDGKTYTPCSACHACDTRAKLMQDVEAFKLKSASSSSC